MPSSSGQIRFCAGLIFTLTAVLNGRTAEHGDLPIVRSNSTTADIQDGNRLLHGAWTIQPEVELETYYAKRARGGRKFTLRTDIDSISFDLRPGQNYDFIVVLNGTQRCRSRISTLHEPCYKEGMPGAPAEDAIPFTIGRDHKIHLAGKIGESVQLDLLFDTGADTLALYPSGFAKVQKLRVDGVIKNGGTGGASMCRTSSDNRVELGALRWVHESLILIDKQVDQADGIIGHNLFEDKVVEIDYDAKLLRLSDTVPERAKSWTSVPIRFNGTLPSLRVRFECGQMVFDEWLVMDTGSDLSVQLNRGSAELNRLHGSMKRLGSGSMSGTGDGTIRNEIMLLPKLSFGKEELLELPVFVEDLAGAQQQPGGHFGMDVLKRYNTILDFRVDMAYLSPSSLYGSPYRTEQSNNRWRIALAVAVSLLLGAAIVLYWRRTVARSRVKPAEGPSDGSHWLS